MLDLLQVYDMAHWRKFVLRTGASLLLNLRLNKYIAQSGLPTLYSIRLKHCPTTFLQRPLNNDPRLPLQSRLKPFCGSTLFNREMMAGPITIVPQGVLMFISYEIIIGYRSNFIN